MILQYRIQKLNSLLIKRVPCVLDIENIRMKSADNLAIQSRRANLVSVSPYDWEIQISGVKFVGDFAIQNKKRDNIGV